MSKENCNSKDPYDGEWDFSDKPWPEGDANQFDFISPLQYQQFESMSESWKKACENAVKLICIQQQRPPRYKHVFHHKKRFPDGTIHTFTYRWNDCDNESMRENIERLALDGFLSVNSELFGYVMRVCKSWKF